MVETSAADILKHNTHINDYDVLLGRGGATNNHPGNKHFRDQVSEHRKEYLTARKKEKIGIARRIVAIIQSNGGRFLKRTPTDDWVEVDDKRAQEKTSQALREGLDVRNKKVRPAKFVLKSNTAGTPQGLTRAVIPGKVIVLPQAAEDVVAQLCPHHKATTTVVVPELKKETEQAEVAETDADTEAKPPVFQIVHNPDENNHANIKVEDKDVEMKPPPATDIAAAAAAAETAIEQSEEKAAVASV